MWRFDYYLTWYLRSHAQVLGNWLRWHVDPDAPKRAKAPKQVTPIASTQPHVATEPRPSCPVTPSSSSTHVTPSSLSNILPFSDIAAMLKVFHSKPRRPRIQHFYSHFHWEERIAAVYAELVAASPNTTAAPIQTVTMAIDRCWEAESDDFKQELKEKMDKLFSEQLHDWDTLVNATDGMAVSPEERGR